MDNIGLARELRRCAAVMGAALPLGDCDTLREAADRLEVDAATLEEYAEIGAETSVGLAWAAGDAESPRTCSGGCKLPHLGPRSYKAISDGLKALREGTWNPPGREGP